MPSQGFIPIILTLALGRHRRSPLKRGGFFLSQGHPTSGRHRGWGTGDGGGVVAESLERSCPWGVGFFFGNTELSLELWNIISGISGSDD